MSALIMTDLPRAAGGRQAEPTLSWYGEPFHDPTAYDPHVHSPASFPRNQERIGETRVGDH
jgi:hypothetical protein